MLLAMRRRASSLPSLCGRSTSIPSQNESTQPPMTMQQTPGSAWDPAAPYITAGQDEPGYRSWYLAAPWRAAQVKSFNDYLSTYQVSGIVPTWELLRTA